jgi:hypothetical protein
MNIIKYVVKTRSDSSAGEYFLDREGVGGSNPSQIIFVKCLAVLCRAFSILKSPGISLGCKKRAAELIGSFFLLFFHNLTNDFK